MEYWYNMIDCFNFDCFSDAQDEYLLGKYYLNIEGSKSLKLVEKVPRSLKLAEKHFKKAIEKGSKSKISYKAKYRLAIMYCEEPWSFNKHSEEIKNI